MTLSDWVQAFLNKRAPAGLFLDATQGLNCGLEATRYYLAWQAIRSAPTAEAENITGATDLDADEWGVIAPLFDLCCERETALMIEASRGQGAEALGRSSSEVANEIAQRYLQMQKEAFYEPVFSIGL